MNRLDLKVLLVNDNDVECKTDHDLTKMTVANLNFIPSDLDGYDMIIYQGTKGTKVLRSKHTKTGIIG